MTIHDDLWVIKTATRLGKEECQKQIVEFINKYAAEWERPNSINVRAEFLKLAEQIKEMKMSKILVTVYTTPNCVKCEATKRMMDKLEIEYEVRDLTNEPEKLAEFKAAGHLVAPIVTTDTKLWSDFRPAKIESLANHIRSLKRAE